MRYVLNNDFVIRGWYKLPYAIFDLKNNAPYFIDRDDFKRILYMTGKKDVNLSDEKEREFITFLLKRNMIHEAVEGETRSLYYKYYPSMYKQSVQWSITGKCNYCCKHCFQSAFQGILGEPTLEQCLDIVRQLDECGIRNVSLTGGEALIRKDFFTIVDEITRRGMSVTTIYSNGKLVTPELLKKMKEHNIHPAFQISFDGVGCHDWMRGYDGAEKIALDAIMLLHDNGYHVGSAMCLCRENVNVLRETVNTLAAAGCRSLKVQCTTPLGEWQSHTEDYLTIEETLQAYLDYIPKYKEDGCPLELQLEGFFLYDRKSDSYCVPDERNMSDDMLDMYTPCSVVKKSLYIGPNGAVVPCMSMCGSEIEKQFPNLFESSLSEILMESSYTEMITKSMRYQLESQPECCNCPHKCICCGGCRAMGVVSQPDNYFAPDPIACVMHKNGWVNKIHEVADKLWKRMPNLMPTVEEIEDKNC